MRYESESKTWSVAAGIVRARVRALPEFSQCRALVVSHALVACRGKSVAQMRELGGFSAVLLTLVNEMHSSSLDTNVGSQLLPASVRSELRAEVPAMRAEVQRALAEGRAS